MSNLLLKLIKFGIGLILFIPLYVGGSFFFPFIFPKIWLFQLAIELIFFLYVILAISDSRFRPKFNLVTITLAALTLVLIITSFTGIDAFRSFWGNTERMSGIIAWFHFVAFAVVLASVLKTEKEWKIFFGIAATVSIWEFLYVLGQYFVVSWVWLPGSQIGTIGNNDLLGSYAIFSAFFSLYLWRKGSLKYNAINWLWPTAFFLNIGTLYFAGSRGAIIGFLAGIFVYFIYEIWQKKEARKFWLILFIVFITASALLWIERNSNFVRNNYQLGRLTQISLSSDTTQQRLTEWGIAWNAFKARPLVGFGPNNYLYLHNTFLDPKVYELRETNFDRAHNAYLDYASMSGILGLLGYIFLIVALAFTFWKDGLRVWTFLIAAYAVQSFFVFDSPASFIALFLTIGFAMHVAESAKTQSLNIKAVPQNPKIFSPQAIVIFSIFYFLFSIFLIWEISWKPAVANATFVKAFSGLSNSTVAPEEAFSDYKAALQYETLGTTEFRNQYINWIQSNIGKFKPENRLEIVDFGIDELEKEVKDHPLVFSYLNLGQMYYMKASGISDPNLRPALYQKSAEAYDKALELSPKRLEVYYSYLRLALDVKDYNRSIALLQKTTEFAPNYYKNWWYLGIANIAAGNNSDGIRYINKALTIWYAPNAIMDSNGLDLKSNLDEILKYGPSAHPPTQEIIGVVKTYIDAKRWNELLLLYLTAETNDPNDPKIHESLALAYQNLGLHDKAQGEINISNRLQQGIK